MATKFKMAFHSKRVKLLVTDLSNQCVAQKIPSQTTVIHVVQF